MATFKQVKEFLIKEGFITEKEIMKIEKRAKRKHKDIRSVLNNKQK